MSRESVLRYWRAVEFFSPQILPRKNPLDRIEPVVELTGGEMEPWHEDHPLQQRRTPGRTSRRHMAYCGVYKIERVKEALEEAFGRDLEAFDERMEGESCIFAIAIAHDGRPLFETFTLSSCAWATGRLRSPGPDSARWLEGFEEAEELLRESFAKRFSVRRDDSRGISLAEKGLAIGRPINVDELILQAGEIAREIGSGALSVAGSARVRSSLVASRRHYTGDDSDFLNSFFLRDLRRVAEAARAEQIGLALSQYLREDHETDPRDRIDLTGDRSGATQFSILAPHRFSPARWPAAGHHPLVCSQQVAANAIREELGAGSGMFAVNGPPGTGKTTLLRDVIADVVVERAHHLAKLRSPGAAFTGARRTWRSGRYTRSIALWATKFSGFEVVVASSNNGAVENVTAEVPAAEAIDASWTTAVDYYRDLATQVLGRPAWALVAARLGNKANRSDFVNRFWYGGDDGDGDGPGGMLAMLKASAPVDWRRAVAAFNRAVAAEQAARAERTAAYERIGLLIDLRGRVEDAVARTIYARTEIEEAAEVEDTARGDAARSAATLERVVARRRQHYRFRPGFLDIMLSFGRSWREWRRTDVQHQQAVAQAQRVADAAEARREAAAGDLRRAVTREQHVTAERDALQTQLERVRGEIQRDAALLGSSYPSPSGWREARSRELLAPWADRRWNDARASVFLAALELHQAFIQANAEAIRRNLQAAMDVLAGAVPEHAPADGVAAAWTTLFLVVPVVSTTFASLDRVFSHLGRESLGWVLIDEAGQAPPQAAAGAVWRARRCVVVGDPLQLEPIVTIPRSAQEALRRYYSVAETWVPGTTSVQGLADRTARYGATVETDDGPLRIGAPLRVHRRCDEPMFSVSNRIAYGGSMVFGTAPRPPLALRPSCWIHVDGQVADGHWIGEEGAALDHLLGELLGHVPAESIFLISPFRDVVRQLRRRVEAAAGIRAGTVHTVQGKEADVVVLVLGGNPQRPGAKYWAASSPNLLNVAVTRARRRLFVIGNQTDWRKHRFFRDLAALLPLHSPPDA